MPGGDKNGADKRADQPGSHCVVSKRFRLAFCIIYATVAGKASGSNAIEWHCLMSNSLRIILIDMVAESSLHCGAVFSYRRGHSARTVRLGLRRPIRSAGFRIMR